MTFLDRALALSFQLHDGSSAFLARHFFRVKTALLIVAHLTLLGFLFPDIRREFGEAAGNLLIFILFLSPLSKIFRIRLLQQLMGLRREMGILFGYLATVHGLGYLSDPYINTLFRTHFPEEPSLVGWPLVLGFGAYLLTLPLLITSNNLATRLLGGRNWKLLHRTIYVMALLTVLHRFMMNGSSPQALVEMIFLVSTYILAKLLAWRNFLPPLAKLIAWVTEKYRQFKTLPVPPQPIPPTFS